MKIEITSKVGSLNCGICFFFAPGISAWRKALGVSKMDSSAPKTALIGQKPLGPAGRAGLLLGPQWGPVGGIALEGRTAAADHCEEISVKCFAGTSWKYLIKELARHEPY